MITLKREKGVYYVAFNYGGERLTEGFDKFSTALKFIKILTGRN